ncbi:3-hydroxybutyryl-CoA dehydrogenase [Dethiosulfatibacter aminovorans DSM 17477]|uniref:3-hydroxybutyryl-CoA dehydrogenase n=1 Tax=Dethiosulfatibacter aminovorans DSM 17477 TaxID=1121476 RepID=A0A1M6ENR3_9FIRM|nr:3-hydroxyacyl-CoA dehydrogenase family protein [Dethiosulfatibacter aminovorans]SHI87112.1 3-hydroxybutyryl-CoA dehydrogenase [Dethiosulfatibacter aminovorans DSM 17477]
MKKVAVIGAGMMGREIAIVFAKAGYQTAIVDATLELAFQAKDKQAGILDREIKKGRLEADRKQEILARITPIADKKLLADYDYITEAIPEIYEFKEGLFKELDEICKPETIFLTNTSTFSVTKLSLAVKRERKARFLGTHYFSPASVMKLVEVIPGHLCEDEIVEDVIALMTEMGKEAVRVNDVTGFVVNRIYHAIMIESLKLLEEGVANVEDIDRACKFGMGHPTGPFELYDNTALDLNLQVQTELFENYGERFRPGNLLGKKVNAGQLGRKVGEGFYVWTDNKKSGIAK